MTDAPALVAKIRADLEEAESALRQHPYPDAVEAGEISTEGLRAFPGHQHHVVSSDLRAFAFMVQRFGSTSARDFFAGVLQGELAALAGVAAFGRKVGMEEAELEAYEVTPGGFAYAAYVTWQSAYASAGEIACSLLVNFDAWGHNCGRLSHALKKRHGFADEDTAFLDAFATMPSFEAAAHGIIQADLDRGVDPALMKRGSRLIQDYERMFWDAMELAGRSAPTE